MNKRGIKSLRREIEMSIARIDAHVRKYWSIEISTSGTNNFDEGQEIIIALREALTLLKTARDGLGGDAK